MTINLNPDDVLTIEDRVRKLMNSNKVIGEIKYSEHGISRRMYALIRKMVTLKDSKSMSVQEKVQMDQAIAVLSQSVGLSRARGSTALVEARRMTKDIFDRHAPLHHGNRDRSQRTKIGKKLESTVFMIRETCTNNDETQIPAMSEDERRKYLDDLTDSMISIANLMAKLKGKSND